MHTVDARSGSMGSATAAVRSVPVIIHVAHVWLTISAAGVETCITQPLGYVSKEILWVSKVYFNTLEQFRRELKVK